MTGYANYSFKARVMAFCLDILTFPLQFYKKKNPDMNIRKILLVRPDHLGDLMMNLDAIYSLKKNIPGCQIHLITPEWNRVVAERLDFVDKIYTVNLKWYCFNHEKHWRLTEVIKFAFRLRKEKFDMFIDFRGDFRIVFLFGFLTGASVRRGFFNLGGKHLLNDSIRFDRTIHFWEQNFRLVEKFTPEKFLFRFELNNSENDKIDGLCHRHGLESGSFVVIHPTVARYWDVKKWGEDKYVKIALYLMSRYNLKIVICSGPMEKETGDRVAGMLPGSLNLSGQLALFEFASLLNHSLFLISNYSAPMHLAVKLEVPLIAIFGPTNFRRSGPYPFNRQQIAIEGKAGLKRPVFGIKKIKAHYFPKIASVIKEIDGLIQIINPGSRQITGKKENP
jgi:ADP-heptose:LPS heptosyltransferase